MTMTGFPGYFPSPLKIPVAFKIAGLFEWGRLTAAFLVDVNHPLGSEILEAPNAGPLQ